MKNLIIIFLIIPTLIWAQEPTGKEILERILDDGRDKPRRSCAFLWNSLRAQNGPGR